MKRGLDVRSCARSGRKDVVGEVKGIEMMGRAYCGKRYRFVTVTVLHQPLFLF